MIVTILPEISASVDIRLVGASDACGLDFFHRVRTHVPGNSSEEAEEDADDAEDQNQCPCGCSAVAAPYC
jgi:hypothetical protein